MVPWVGLQCGIVVFPDHTHLLSGLVSRIERVVSVLSCQEAKLSLPLEE